MAGKIRKKTSPSKKNPYPAAMRKADILKALAHPFRIMILELLAGGEMTVGQIVAGIGAKEANTSRHLAVMRSAGLVASRKEGLNIYYSNKMTCFLSLLSCLDDGVCELADEQGEIAKLLRSKTSN